MRGLAPGAAGLLQQRDLGVATPVDVADNDRATLADLKSDVASALGSSGLGGLVDVTLTGGTTLRFALPSTSNNPLGYASESVGLTGEFIASWGGEASQPASLDNLLERMDRGEFDMVAVGRALLQDPEWVVKIREGRTADLKSYDRAALGVLY